MQKKSLLIFLFFSSFLIILLFIILNYKYRKVGENDTTKNVKSSLFSRIEAKNEIGVLEIDGVITDSNEILKKIRILKKRDAVKGILVRINSPGGAVSPSQEIYEELKKLDEIKPVVASFSSLAASGGYYIALGARKIVANKGTLTGSIGVIMNLIDLQELYKFIKINPRTIKSGKYKDIGNASRDMTESEKQILQNMSDDIHKQFKEALSESRKIPFNNLDNITDGRVFTGLQAYELGLVDELGTFEDAISLLAELSKVSVDSELYYPKIKKDSFKDLFLNMNTFLNFINSKLQLQIL